MFVQKSATLVAALSLLASVDAKRQQLNERGTRCNGDNLLNRFRGPKFSDAAVSFCQTFISSVSYSVVTVSTDEAHVSSPVTTYSPAYPTPLLTTSYADARLSSACSCVSPSVVTAVVTEYVASTTAAVDDAATTTAGDSATVTDDPTSASTDDSATSTDDSSPTSTDDTVTTATDDTVTTATDDAATTATDDSTPTVTDPTTSATDDPTTTATDDSTPTATDDASTTSTDDPSTPTSVPAAPTSQGCYVEGTSERALSNLVLASDTLTIPDCAAACSTYAFFGVEFGRECWCADSISTSAFLSPDTTVCNMPCKGDLSTTCGGSSTINIYGSSDPTTAPPAESPYTLTGCFAEPDGARALPQVYASAKMTIELCHQTCSLAGYTFAGLEYSTECWCGNSVPTLTPLGAEQCSAPCAGDATETCGGSNALQLYTATAN